MIVNKRAIGTFVLIILGVTALSALLPAQKKMSVKDLPPQYQKWLQEEVVYIISTKERDVFLQLESDRERNIFIEAFWKQRNPDPGSSENAYKVEHYKRIAYANQWLGKSLADARLEDRPGPRLDPARPAEGNPGLREPLRPPAGDHLVLRRHGRVRPAGIVLPRLLEKGHRRRLPALFADQRRAPDSSCSTTWAT